MIRKKKRNKKKNIVMPKDEWNKIFESSKTPKVWGICILLSAIAIIVMTYISNTEENEPLYNTMKKAAPEIITAISTGILGAASLNLVYREHDNKKFQLIKSLDYDDLLSSFFQCLHELNGKIRYDEEIEVKFLEFQNAEGKETDSLYKIRISYKYKTFLENDFIKFRFERINDNANNINDNANNINDNRVNMLKYSSGLNNELLEYEFFWGNDETDFEYDGITNEDYKVYDVFIGEHKEDLIIEYSQKSPSVLEYIYKLPLTEKVERNIEYIPIRYVVELPMERESVLFLTHELPTKDVSVIIDYSDIEEKTNIYTIPVTGAIPIRKHDSQEKGKEIYEYTGWILPKAGYVISWWDV